MTPIFSLGVLFILYVLASVISYIEYITNEKSQQ